MIARVAASAAAAVLVVGVFAACATGAPGRPDRGDVLPVEPDGSIGTSACAEAFPSPLGGTDIAEASILPADWPAGPAGSTLCSAAMTSDYSAVVQYVTQLSPDDVLAYYEPLLGQYEPVVSDGIGGHPILNGARDGFEFAIQTDGELGTFLVAATVES